MTCITSDIRRYLRDLAQTAAEADGEIMLGHTDASVVAAALQYCADAAVIAPEVANAALEYCARTYAQTASA